MKKTENKDPPYSLSMLSNLPESNKMRKFFDKLLDANNDSGYNPKEDKPTGNSVENGIRYRTFVRNIPDISEFKTRIFKCTEYVYDSEGRINYLKFEEQEQKETEEIT